MKKVRGREQLYGLDLRSRSEFTEFRYIIDKPGKPTNQPFKFN